MEVIRPTNKVSMTFPPDQAPDSKYDGAHSSRNHGVAHRTVVPIPQPFEGLLRLPNELLLKIFKLLPTRSFQRFSHVCRRLYNISYDPVLHLPHFKWTPKTQLAGIPLQNLREKRLRLHKSLWVETKDFKASDVDSPREHEVMHSMEATVMWYRGDQEIWGVRNMRFGSHLLPGASERKLEGLWVTRTPLGDGEPRKVVVQQKCKKEWDFKIAVVPGPTKDWELLIF